MGGPLGCVLDAVGSKQREPGLPWERFQSDLGQSPELSIRIFFEIGFEHCPEFRVLDGVPELEFNGAILG